MAKKDSNQLTAREYDLVQYILKNPKTSEHQACIAVGYAAGSTQKVLTRPRVRAAIDHVLTTRLEKVGEESVKAAVVTKAVIEKEALKIAKDGGTTPQVNALRLLAEMNGLIVQKTADVTEELKNKSPEELEYFSINGYWPNNVEPGKSRSAESESSSQSPTQPNTKPN